MPAKQEPVSGEAKEKQVKWPSRFVLRNTALVSLVAAAISISLSTGLRMIIGAEADLVTVIMRLVLPFAIAIPIALVGFSKLDQVLKSYRALMRRSSELARHAATDPLTGLLNRRSFVEQFDLAMSHGVSGLFVLADADHLKRINDQHGHLAGDDAIVAIAQALENVLGDDSLIGRIGGDEFCAFLPNRSGGPDATWLAEINQIASVEFARRSNIVGQSLSVSLGIASCRAGTTFREAMERTDMRLYGHKHARRDAERAA
ncbi:GGDEF domain-containing protein [Devosia sp. CC-YST696]|nr:GGDEF domain-containing protein [Devosia faecipullorum]